MKQAKLAEALRGPSDEVKEAVKDYLHVGRGELKKTHLKVKAAGKLVTSYPGREVTTANTHLTDALLSTLFQSVSNELSGVSSETSLVAIGGYGRGELNISSDIDILLLYKKKITSEIEQLTQRILYILWDAGLDVGFAVRSVKESIALATDDLKTKTALLDMRLILGDETLFETLLADTKKRLFSKRGAKAFVEEKLEEHRERHKKYGRSVYILEPNIRESAGGLRDLHSARWLLQASSGTFDADLRSVLTEQEHGYMVNSVDFLLWVRNDVHFESARKTDQLTFDHQERIAKRLGFKKTVKSLPVEKFMQVYYTHASNISRFSSLAVSRLLARSARKRVGPFSRKKQIDDDFTVDGGELTARGREVFTKDPDKIMRAFELSKNEGVPIAQTTKDLMLEILDEPGGAFATTGATAESFIRILGSNGGVYETLSEMHKIRFLERIIPEFGEITCKVQHDLYHVYTVDAHTLFAVGELDGLAGAYEDEFSLLCSLYKEVSDPAALYLGVLFHDIGKSLGKGHAEKGAQMIGAIAKRLGLSGETEETVTFLVRHHLALADTAQYRDLHDEKLIIDFAKMAGDVERLNLLYLLTFADVRAVGPDIWNNWKGALFQELYFNVRQVLERGVYDEAGVEQRIASIKGDVTSLARDVESDALDNYFSLLPTRYFLSNSPEQIAKHISITRELKGRPYVFKVNQDTERQYTELVFCTHDMHGLFSLITGVMAANSVNILGAQINTLRSGIALDVLHVKSSYGELITDKDKLAAIEKDLSEVVTGRLRDTMLASRIKPSMLDKVVAPAVKTRVEIDNEVSDTYTVIDVRAPDKLGLLYSISSALMKLGLYIHVAKISTKGGEATDIFYVHDIFGQKIFFKERLDDIVSAIRAALEGSGDGEKSKGR